MLDLNLNCFPQLTFFEGCSPAYDTILEPFSWWKLVTRSKTDSRALSAFKPDNHSNSPHRLLPLCLSRWVQRLSKVSLSSLALFLSVIVIKATKRELQVRYVWILCSSLLSGPSDWTTSILCIFWMQKLYWACFESISQCVANFLWSVVEIEKF